MNNIEKLKENLPKELDAVVIGSDVGRFYFLGFPSSAGTLVITKEKNYFIIDSRYIEIAKRSVKDCEVILEGSRFSQMAKIFEEHGAKKIGFETGYMSCEEYLIMKNKLTDFEFVLSNELTDIIRKQRAIKTPEEIASIKKAQKITDDAFSHILKFIKPGLTEKEIALELEFYARKNGAEAVSFDFIVVSGKNSSLPHGVPSSKKIENGDFVTMDIGVKVDGYCSDMTRTVAVGFATDEMKKVYATVLEANLRAERIAKAGMLCSDIDASARDYIASMGYGDCFGHGLGHSVGIEIHEDPRFSPKCHDVFEENMIITVEPGIYLEGKFGVRIEDMIIGEKDGCEIITKSPKELIIL